MIRKMHRMFNHWKAFLCRWEALSKSSLDWGFVTIISLLLLVSSSSSSISPNSLQAWTRLNEEEDHAHDSTKPDHVHALTEVVTSIGHVSSCNNQPAKVALTPFQYAGCVLSDDLGDVRPRQRKRTLCRRHRRVLSGQQGWGEKRTLKLFFWYSYSRAREPSCSGLPWDVSTSSTQFSEFFFYETNASGFSTTLPLYSILESARNKRLPVSSWS